MKNDYASERVRRTPFRRRTMTISVALLVCFFGTMAFARQRNQVLSQSCWTRAQIEQENTSQTRCLYTLYDVTSHQTEVWNPEGNSYKIHKNQPCATDVTCSMNPSNFTTASTGQFNPLLRLKNIVKNFLPEYFLGYMCPGESLHPATVNTDNTDYIPIWTDPANDTFNVCQPQPTATPTVPPVNTPTNIPPTLTPIPPSASPTPPPGSTATPTDSCPKRSLGDANCDGSISLVDAESWRREFRSEVQTVFADFNQDGRVSLQDYESWRRGFQP